MPIRMNVIDENSFGPAAAPLVFRYKNHRGVTESRQAIPQRIYYGTSEYHKRPQWLMDAYCVDRKTFRTFALDCMWPED